MVKMLHRIVSLSVLWGLASSQMLPDSQAFVINELEHTYFDNTGPQGFKSGLVPCTIYFDSSTGGVPNDTLGRQTSAQWIRTSFRKVHFLGILAAHIKLLRKFVTADPS